MFLAAHHAPAVFTSVTMGLPNLGCTAAMTSSAARFCSSVWQNIALLLRDEKQREKKYTMRRNHFLVLHSNSKIHLNITLISSVLSPPRECSPKGVERHGSYCGYSAQLTGGNRRKQARKTVVHCCGCSIGPQNRPRHYSVGRIHIISRC